MPQPSMAAAKSPVQQSEILVVEPAKTSSSGSSSPLRKWEYIQTRRESWLVQAEGPGLRGGSSPVSFF
jgi:hypothetical protein